MSMPSRVRSQCFVILRVQSNQSQLKKRVVVAKCQCVNKFLRVSKRQGTSLANSLKLTSLKIQLATWTNYSMVNISTTNAVVPITAARTKGESTS